MRRKKPKLLIFDPYNPEIVKYQPELFKRISEFARDVTLNANHEALARQIMAKAMLGDPSLMILFAVLDGKVVTHGVLEIIEVDLVKTCFFGQFKNDVPYFAEDQFYVAKNWAKSNGCVSIRTECVSSVFNEKTAVRLWRRLGYKLVSYSLELDIS